MSVWYQTQSVFTIPAQAMLRFRFSLTEDRHERARGTALWTRQSTCLSHSPAVGRPFAARSGHDIFKDLQTR